MADNEKNIIEEAIKGQQWAFESLLNKYSLNLFNFILRIIKNREEAEEVTQDVFLKAFTSLASFKGESSFATWLYAIGKNLALNRLKTLTPKGEMLDIDSLNISNDLHGHVMESNLNEEFLLNALKYIDQADSLLLGLFYVNQLSLKEIAAVINIEPNNVKIKLFRARKKFRDVVLKLQKKENEYLNNL